MYLPLTQVKSFTTSKYFIDAWGIACYQVGIMRRKTVTERAIKKSVSMPLCLFMEAIELQREQRLSTFSDLLQMLIRDRLQIRDAAQN